MSQPERVFLTAEWRNLLMLNYEVDPDLLRKYVPTAVHWIRSRAKPTKAIDSIRERL